MTTKKKTPQTDNEVKVTPSQGETDFVKQMEEAAGNDIKIEPIVETEPIVEKPVTEPKEKPIIIDKSIISVIQLSKEIGNYKSEKMTGNYVGSHNVKRKEIEKQIAEKMGLKPSVIKRRRVTFVVTFCGAIPEQRDAFNQINKCEAPEWLEPTFSKYKCCKKCPFRIVIPAWVLLSNEKIRKQFEEIAKKQAQIHKTLRDAEKKCCEELTAFETEKTAFLKENKMISKK